jgi:hypothetical protein
LLSSVVVVVAAEASDGHIIMQRLLLN